MRILWLNPYHGGSHAAVADGYAAHSHHAVTVLALPTTGGWRWRMRGGALTLARRVRAWLNDHQRPDLLVATDMLDLASFLGLTRDLLRGIPTALYMHENQLTYPLPPGRTRDLSFPWINYTSALAADHVLFNSAFHRRTFLDALPGLPGRFHDFRELDLIDEIARKSAVLPPGLDLARLTLDAPVLPHVGEPPTILWNARWEYDKNPQAFFDALAELDQRGVAYRLIVAGEHIDPDEPAFLAARARCAPRTRWWGYAPDLASYRTLLHQADIVVSTAVQEFFGIAVLEAMFCGCVPVLPRRLSYPEIIPAELHACCLYDQDSDLADRLQATLEQLPALPRDSFRAVAAAYDWRTLAQHYDTTFGAMVQ